MQRWAAPCSAVHYDSLSARRRQRWAAPGSVVPNDLCENSLKVALNSAAPQNLFESPLKAASGSVAPQGPVEGQRRLPRYSQSPAGGSAASQGPAEGSAGWRHLPRHTEGQRRSALPPTGLQKGLEERRCLALPLTEPR